MDFNSIVNISLIIENINQIETFNFLGIQGLSNLINSYILGIIRDNSLELSKSKPIELLNYQSNVLYVLINGLFPSIC